MTHFILDAMGGFVNKLLPLNQMKWVTTNQDSESHHLLICMGLIIHKLVFVGLKLKYPFLSWIKCTLLILDYHQYYNRIIFFSPLRLFVQRKMQTYFQNLHFGGSMGESYIILWKWWFDCWDYLYWICWSEGRVYNILANGLNEAV